MNALKYMGWLWKNNKSSQHMPSNSGGQNWAAAFLSSSFALLPGWVVSAGLPAALSAIFLSSFAPPSMAAFLASASSFSSFSEANSSLVFLLSASFLASAYFFSSAALIRPAFLFDSFSETSSWEADGSASLLSLNSRTSCLISPYLTFSSKFLFSPALMNHLLLSSFSAHWTDLLVSMVSMVSSSESSSLYGVSPASTFFIASGSVGEGICPPVNSSAILMLLRVSVTASSSL